MNTVTFILFGLLLHWNWGGSSPQFQKIGSTSISEKQIAKIHFREIPNNMVEIEGTFYNDRNSEIFIDYKLSVTKSGQSKSTSNQSGNFTVESKQKIVLSKSTVNLNRNDLYKIKLRVLENNRVIAEDSATFYGDSIIQN